MKSIYLMVIAVATLAATEVSAAGCRDMVCHNNPTCQRLRNAGNCAGAAAALSAPGGYSRSDNAAARGGGNKGQPGGSGARY